MEKDPTGIKRQPPDDSIESQSESAGSLEEQFHIGDFVDVTLPSNNPFQGMPARIREVNEETRKVMVDFALFGRWNKNFLEIDFKDVKPRKD